MVHDARQNQGYSVKMSSNHILSKPTFFFLKLIHLLQLQQSRISYNSQNAFQQSTDKEMWPCCFSAADFKCRWRKAISATERESPVRKKKKKVSRPWFKPQPVFMLQCIMGFVLLLWLWVLLSLYLLRGWSFPPQHHEQIKRFYRRTWCFRSPKKEILRWHKDVEQTVITANCCFSLSLCTRTIV